MQAQDWNFLIESSRAQCILLFPSLLMCLAAHDKALRARCVSSNDCYKDLSLTQEPLGCARRRRVRGERQELTAQGGG